MLVGIEEPDQSAEDHVDGRRVEGRAEQDEQRLPDKGREGPVGRFPSADDAEDVAYCLDCCVTVSATWDCGESIKVDR